VLPWLSGAAGSKKGWPENLKRKFSTSTEAPFRSFALVRRRGRNLDESMPSPRKRLSLALAVVLLAALAVFVPSFLYFTELALRELRFLWWLILLLVGAIWLLGALGRKK
jgi:hypothetical protein